ncbi:MAG TPA: histidine--tRNA ligase [Anaerolineaceae bacterium]|nr:histidine--tRNA ligase [Anaerolineaceae bacterium]
MEPTVQTVKGAREFYPEAMALRNWLAQNMRAVSIRYGYQEYDGPFLEKIDLYAAKSGEELVKEQAFVFPDRGGDLIALRPELTPSLARMVAQRQGELTFPLRWWSFGPFWRYERPQKGRTREFFQWNIDLIGINSPEADAELIAICAEFIRSVGLSPQQAVILVNDRRLMDQELSALGLTGDLKAQTLRLIDRRDKLRPAEWDEFALSLGITAGQLAGLKALLSNAELWQKYPDMCRLFAALEALGVREYIQFDAGIIRGLEYYTGTVFEAFDADRTGRAILGGGHYDNLVSDVGGDPLPGVGFAMGDMMIAVVLEKYDLLPDFDQASAPVLVTVFDAALQSTSIRLAAELRSAGLGVNCYPEAAKLPKQFKFADRIGARFVLIIGPDEQTTSAVTIKDLVRHEQETLPQDSAAGWIKQRLAQAPSV